MNMTDEQIRITIAEACGVQTRMFRFLIPYHDGQRIYRSHYKTREAAEEDHRNQGEWVLSGVEEYIELSHVPDYLNDLNAMQSAIFHLDPLQRAMFQQNLGAIATAHSICFCECTSRMWADAFIKTLNLESKP